MKDRIWGICQGYIIPLGNETVNKSENSSTPQKDCVSDQHRLLRAYDRVIVCIEQSCGTIEFVYFESALSKYEKT